MIIIICYGVCLLSLSHYGIHLNCVINDPVVMVTIQHRYNSGNKVFINILIIIIIINVG